MKKLCVILAICSATLAPVYAHASAAFTLPSGVHVRIVEAPFHENDFKVSGCDDSDVPCRIDGHLAYGVAFGIPKTYVESITVSYKGKSYALNSSDMYNAWGDRPLEVKGVVRYFGGQCSDPRDCQFRGIFSDGAGTFVAQWRVVDGISRREVLTSSSDIIGLFMHHIDPPE